MSADHGVCHHTLHPLDLFTRPWALSKHPNILV
jgi:hypothetical protein